MFQAVAGFMAHRRDADRILDEGGMGGTCREKPPAKTMFMRGGDSLTTTPEVSRTHEGNVLKVE